MDIIDLDRGETSALPVACALGNFDGFHIGHQALIKEAMDLAAQAKARGDRLLSSALLFACPPSNRTKLMSLEDKIRFLEAQGLDRVFIKRFDPAFMALPPEGFMRDYLEDRMQAAYLVTGHDYSFGYKAQGHIQDLEAEGERGAFQLKVVPNILYQGDRVSSTRIRAAIQAGDLDQAQRMLGRPYTIHGHIDHGAGRGTGLGFPTANLILSYPYLLPKEGVYLSYMTLGLAATTLGPATAPLAASQFAMGSPAAVGGSSVKPEGGPWPGRTSPSDLNPADGPAPRGYFGMTNIGTNPTFTDAGEVWVETHLFDFQEDIYGMEASLTFLAFQREEITFDSPEALVEQMKRDEAESRERMLAYKRLSDQA